MKNHCLTAESVQSTSLAFQSIDDIHGSHGLPLGMLGVGDSIPDDILQEDLEDTSGFFVDQARNTLDSTTTSKTTDGGLGDSLDVVAQNLAMALGPALPESLSSLSASRHDDGCCCWIMASWMWWGGVDEMVRVHYCTWAWR